MNTLHLLIGLLLAIMAAREVWRGHYVMGAALAAVPAADSLSIWVGR
jgi:hypothetical protein